MSAKIPTDFICPITNEIMEDPVIDPDGNSYERVAIMEWLQLHQTSPITRHFLLPTQLIPNRALRNTIENYRTDYPDAFANYVPESKDSKGVLQDLRADAKRANLAEAKDGETSISSEDRENKAESKDEDPPLTRRPLMLFTVIDTSGSMQEPCGGNQTEHDGYSRLDLVKHTLNTLFTSLSSHDYASVIKFSTVADVFIPLTKLTSNNKRVMMEKLKHLSPENQTNLWDGLRLTIDEIAALGDVTSHYNVQIYVLTDGEPNINPPGSLAEVVKEHLARRCRHLALSLHTFGYGYKVDSDLLFALSRVGHGCFGFIPDASMVGTVFINALANSLVTEKKALTAIPLAVCEEIERVLYNVISARDVDNRTLLLSRFNVFLDHQDLLAERSGGQLEIIDFIYNLKSDCCASPDPHTGQVHKAIEVRFFNQWGKHYLRSVLSAYQHRVCINFKDKGLQYFKTEAFIDEQKRIENIFVQLPPPRPSNRLSSTNYSSQTSGTNMAQYYDVSGGCFSGDSLILLPQGRSLAAKDLAKGQEVLSDAGVTRVEALVKIRFEGTLYRLGASLRLTAYHPTRIAGRDCFPCEYSTDKEAFDGYVYDVVLENRALLAMQEKKKKQKKKTVFVATLGHRRSSEVFSHDYFGSEQVVKDLQSKSEAWSQGLIVSEMPRYLREEQQQQRIVKVLW